MLVSRFLASRDGVMDSALIRLHLFQLAASCAALFPTRRCNASATARGAGPSGQASSTSSSVFFAKYVMDVSRLSPSSRAHSAQLLQVRARRSTRLVGVLMHPAGAMELRFIKPSFKYKPGQWLYLNVPEVSKFQWHPFTISSAPDDPYVSCHIRQVGDWTR